jgi:hypothetical protein
VCEVVARKEGRKKERGYNYRFVPRFIRNNEINEGTSVHLQYSNF